ncbi:hypothetical protein STRIP9103_07930 [Streptomyces ipomoeae 91-03]|uniref:Uncharacterized protein n=1 Tax=Streptomyces ipomoeae 91-03 TaxID=698759 RepID=L1L874_9ACTN|nr:hypothetical protein STRIP9103_07930 [Streptomyces ipomoeae 91-03]
MPGIPVSGDPVTVLDAERRGQPLGRGNVEVGMRARNPVLTFGRFA